jgi:hypothetical protein
MKVDLSKVFSSIISLSLSPNGDYLITKMVEWASNLSYISVFNSLTGSMVSMISYNIATYDPLINVR